MKKIYLYIIVFLYIVVGIFSSCQDIDSTYKDFVVPGGIIYSGKAVNPVLYTGYNRVKITWLRGSDPKITKARVFWNNYTDSVEVDIPSTQDTISVIVDNLPEQFYNFFIITYDNEENLSVPVEVMGEVYGENYVSKLYNRPVVSGEKDEQGKAFIQWGNADISNGAFAVDVKYLNTTNDTVIYRFDIDEEISELIDFKSGTSYRTAYIPDSTCIDTFYTDFKSIKILEKIPKSLFEIVHLPNDSWQTSGVNVIERVWDDNTSTFYTSLDHVTLPQWWTLDLNQKVVFNRMKLFHRYGYEYKDVAVKAFEIWGSNDPDLDGGWDNWLLLGRFESYKPSGLPNYKTNSSDLNYARSGEDFTFSQPMDPVRYIRFKLIESYSGDAYYHLGELTFWGEIFP